MRRKGCDAYLNGTRAFREVQRCPNEPLKAAKRAAPQSERGTKKTRLRAKFLAQNCYAPTNKRQQKNAVVFVGLPSPRLRGLFLGLILCRNKYKRAMTARFRNVAKGNILRLCDAHEFHAAVKRPPYFTFARSADISPPGTACPACPHHACAVFLGLDTSPMDSVPQLRAPTKNPDSKMPSDIFMSACSSPAASGS